DCYLHLLDGGNAVIHSDHHARKIGLRKDRDGYLKRDVNAGDRQHHREKKDGVAPARKPERPGRPGICLSTGILAPHQSPPPAPLSASLSGSGGAIFTFVPASSA